MRRLQKLRAAGTREVLGPSEAEYKCCAYRVGNEKASYRISCKMLVLKRKWTLQIRFALRGKEDW